MISLSFMVIVIMEMMKQLWLESQNLMDYRDCHWTSAREGYEGKYPP